MNLMIGTNIVSEAENYEVVLIVRVTQTYGNEIGADAIQVWRLNAIELEQNCLEEWRNFLDEALG